MEFVEDFVAVDLETTGLCPRSDRILEIGAVRVKGGEREAVFHTLINPGLRIPERVRELTGISESDTAGAPSLEDALPGLLEFLGDLPLLGHRVLFDYSFLKKACVDRRIPFERRGIDTLKIARKHLPQLEHKNLSYLCAYYDIPHQAHRALGDALAAWQLYEKLGALFFEKDPEAFAPRPLCYQAKRDTPATARQKERLQRLLLLHGLTLEKEVESLTRSEASRFTDRILAAYGRKERGPEGENRGAGSMGEEDEQGENGREDERRA